MIAKDMIEMGLWKKHVVYFGLLLIQNFRFKVAKTGEAHELFL